MKGRVLDRAELGRELEPVREAGKRIVTTNGVFDLLHAGHEFLFAECRKLGDVLVVGVNSDASVRALKPNRPHDPVVVRAGNVAKHADYVFVFEEADPRTWLRELRPHVHATAASYGADCIEAPVVQEIGAKLALVPVRPEFGSTTMRLFRRTRRAAWVSGIAALIGWPLVALWARVRRSRNRILVVPLRGLGDVIQATPIFRAIKQSFPATEVHVLTLKEWATLLDHNPYVDRIFELTPRGRLGLVWRLWRQRYRAVVNLKPGPFGTSLGLWVCAPQRISTSWESVLVEPPAPIPSLINTLIVRRQPDESMFERHMRVVAALGAERVDRTLDCPVSSRARESIDAWLEDRGLRSRPFVIVNPSAGNALKEWPLDHWAALVGRIAAGLGYAVVVSTASREHAGRLCAGTDAVDASSLSLEEAAALYAHASCFVAVDTGPLYVAHASGAPLVVIVGVVGSDDNIPPPADDVVHVMPPPGTKPWETMPSGTARALEDTAVDAVFDAVARLLSDHAGRQVHPDSVG